LTLAAFSNKLSIQILWNGTRDFRRSNEKNSAERQLAYPCRRYKRWDSKTGYGLLIGVKSDYYRDPPDNFGHYYHGNLIIRALLGNYHRAIDVDPKAMPDGYNGAS
jgi:hypothetical protein